MRKFITHRLRCLTNPIIHYYYVHTLPPMRFGCNVIFVISKHVTVIDVICIFCKGVRKRVSHDLLLIISRKWFRQRLGTVNRSYSVLIHMCGWQSFWAQTEFNTAALHHDVAPLVAERGANKYIDGTITSLSTIHWVVFTRPFAIWLGIIMHA